MGKKRALWRPGRSKKRRFKGNQFQVPVDVHNRSSSDESASDSDSGGPGNSHTTDPRQYQSPSLSKLLRQPSCKRRRESSDCSNSSSSRDESDCRSSDLDLSDSDLSSFCDDEDGAGTRGYRLINLEALQELLSSCATCQFCGEGSLGLTEVAREGLASKLALECDECGASTSKMLAQPSGRAWDVNRRAVMGMRWIGRGRQALVKLCGVLDMPPPMSKSSYHLHAKSLHSACLAVASRSMRTAADDVRHLNEDEGRAPETASVSFDGTWMRRGYSSLHGVFTAVSWDVGRVLDFHVSSKFCQQCSTWKSRLEKKKISEHQYEQFLASHQDACSKNTDRSAPGMEAEAAVILWRRSEDDRQLRYTTYIGDGDSKAYNAVCDASPYGDVPIVKEECVGHVQKRVGTNLRNLKKDLRGKKLEDGKTIGGLGRLTDRVIDKLQAYYGMAIRDHQGDLQGMARAIWASVMHRVSTDAKPCHQYCPIGNESWCGWQRRKAGATEEYKHHDSIPQAVFDKIKPLYLRLTDKTLLRRCLRGATQNRNECLNGLIWQMCPKESFAGATTVETAAALAVLWFNDGASSIELVLEELACPVGPFTASSLRALDRDRLYHSGRKAALPEKAARKRRRRVRKGVEEDLVQAEGPAYGPGAFNLG